MLVSRSILITLGLILPLSTSFGTTINYDESLIPNYTLPELMVCSDGTPVETAQDWMGNRRPEVLELFREEVYGHRPGPPPMVQYRVLESSNQALGGTAIRKQIRITVHGTDPDKTASFDLLLYIPSKVKKPAPAFVGLNFKGNHTVIDDPEVLLARPWTGTRPDGEVVAYSPEDQPRGSSSSRWPIAKIIGRGYAIGTVYYGDIDPDFHDGFKNGVHALFRQAGEEGHAPDAWGTIAAWSWGLSRVMDYLETDSSVDASKVAVIGHSRLGKTSLWTGAEDPRFAMVISNDSGCGGAALSRRRIGESVERINTSFPHWFCDNYKKFNGNEDASSVDQHMLIALIASRPVYVASAVEDRWADPRGEFLSLKYAAPVYSLFGLAGLQDISQAEVDEPVGSGAMYYHIRSGGHDVTAFDWEQYLSVADRFLQ